MLQITKKDGLAYPLAFDMEYLDGSKVSFEIERVHSIRPLSEQKSGTVCDRYDCTINGRRQDIFLSKIVPRKWSLVLYVDEKTYNDYYRFPDEK
jgi:hypothetical protein